VSGSERYRIDSDYGKFGKSMTIVTENNAWEEFTSIPMREIYGDLLEQAKRGHPTSFYGDWYDYYDSVFVIRSAEMGGTDVYVLQLVRGELPSVTIYVDTEYGDVLKAEMVIMTEGGVGIPVEVLYEDYKEIDGIRIPSRTISSNEASGRTIMTLEKIEDGLTIEDTFFNPNIPLQE
jgi:hypothetical protein